MRGRHLVTEVTLDQVLEEVALMRKDLKSIEKSHDYLLESLELRKKPAKSWQTWVIIRKKLLNSTKCWSDEAKKPKNILKS